MPKRVLVLDGGGVKGVITLKFLSLLEKNKGINVSEYFDYFAGTSTGGLIASLFAYKRFSATEILEKVYTLETISKIMSQGYYEWALSQMQVRSKYSDKEKISFINKYLDGDKQIRMSNVKCPLLLVSFNPVKKVPILFRNYFHTPDYLLADACNATSAAPTYFPVAKVTQPNNSVHKQEQVEEKCQIDSPNNDMVKMNVNSRDANSESGGDYSSGAPTLSCSLIPDLSKKDEQILDKPEKKDTNDKEEKDYFWAIDGGIFANNPSDLAYLDAKNLFTEPLELLSIGTGICRSKFQNITNPALGGWDWMIDDHIIDLLLDSNQVASHVRTKHLCRIGKDQYLRVNEYLRSASSELDNTTPGNYERLLEEGELWWRLYSDHPFIKNINTKTEL